MKQVIAETNGLEKSSRLIRTGLQPLLAIGTDPLLTKLACPPLRDFLSRSWDGRTKRKIKHSNRSHDPRDEFSNLGNMELSDKNLTVPHPTGTGSLASAEGKPTIVSEETESLILPAPVALKDRIFSLDVIRGVALLGILLANIEDFAAPEALHDVPIGTPIKRMLP
jgi:hypothetical protein